MKRRIINPTDGIYAAASDYVHGLEVRDVHRQLYVSGTMGLNTDGQAPSDLETQLALIWQNIRRILTGADMEMSHIVRVRSYLTDARHSDANQEARLRALGNRRVPTTAIVVSTLDPSWLVEIEVVAAA